MRLRRTALTGAAVVVATVGCLVGLWAGAALAETTTTGVGAAAVMSIADAATAASGNVVTVSGTIGAVIEGNEYTLTDGATEIKIDGGPAWYKALGLKAGDVYTVTGEVDRGKDGTATAEIDIHTATAPDGTVTTVREGSGRPPWAGGPHANGQTPGQGVPDDDTDSD